jgi:hypothetical protein
VLERCSPLRKIATDHMSVTTYAVPRMIEAVCMLLNP